MILEFCWFLFFQVFEDINGSKMRLPKFVNTYESLVSPLLLNDLGWNLLVSFGHFIFYFIFNKALIPICCYFIFIMKIINLLLFNFLFYWTRSAPLLIERRSQLNCFKLEKSFLTKAKCYETTQNYPWKHICAASLLVGMSPIQIIFLPNGTYWHILYLSN